MGSKGKLFCFFISLNIRSYFIIFYVFWLWIHIFRIKIFVFSGGRRLEKFCFHNIAGRKITKKKENWKKGKASCLTYLLTSCKYNAESINLFSGKNVDFNHELRKCWIFNFSLLEHDVVFNRNAFRSLFGLDFFPFFYTATRRINKLAESYCEKIHYYILQIQYEKKKENLFSFHSKRIKIFFFFFQENFLIFLSF